MIKSIFPLLSQRLRILAAMFLCLLALVACENAEFPLCDPETAKPDYRLGGVWHSAVEGNDQFLHIIPSRSPAWLKVHQITHIHWGGYEQSESNDAFPCEIGGKRYLNVMSYMPVQEQSNDGGEPNMEKRFMFLKYEISQDDTLRFWSVPHEVWAKEIEAGRIKGSANSTTWGDNLRITDTTQTLVRAITSPEIDSRMELVGEFRRVQAEKPAQPNFTTPQSKRDEYKRLTSHLK